MPRRLIIAITGASGAILGVRLLEYLRLQPNIETHLLVSSAGWQTVVTELDRSRAEVEARDHLQNAATMAGVAFQNSGLGLVHGISHAIGRSFHVAHGRLNAMIMPHVMALNAGDLSAGGTLSGPALRYSRLAAHSGLQATTARNLVLALIRRVVRLRETLGMPDRVTGAGVDRGEFTAAVPDLATTALADFCSGGNPVVPTHEEVVAILRALV